MPTTRDPAGGTYAVVVLYFRLGPSVMSTLAALEAQTSSAASIVLVDNASGDHVADAAAREHPGTRLLTLPTNVGYAGGMNVGAAHLSETHSDFILFVTHEVRLPPDAVEQLIEQAELTGASVVAPTLVDADGTVFSRGGAFTVTGTARHIRSDGREQPAWLDGAALLVRRSVFEALGGFDESFFLYWEDVDFCDRARGHGPLQLSTTVRVEQSQHGMPPYLNARGRSLFWRKRGRRFHVALAPIAILARSIYAWAYAVATGRTRPPVRFGDIVRGCLDARSGRLRVEESRP